MWPFLHVVAISPPGVGMEPHVSGISEAGLKSANLGAIVRGLWWRLRRRIPNNSRHSSPALLSPWPFPPMGGVTWPLEASRGLFECGTSRESRRPVVHRPLSHWWAHTMLFKNRRVEITQLQATGRQSTTTPRHWGVTWRGDVCVIPSLRVVLRFSLCNSHIPIFCLQRGLSTRSKYLFRSLFRQTLCKLIPSSLKCSVHMVCWPFKVPDFCASVIYDIGRISQPFHTNGGFLYFNQD